VELHDRHETNPDDGGLATDLVPEDFGALFRPVEPFACRRCELFGEVARDASGPHGATVIRGRVRDLCSKIRLQGLKMLQRDAAFRTPDGKRPLPRNTGSRFTCGEIPLLRFFPEFQHAKRRSNNPTADRGRSAMEHDYSKTRKTVPCRAKSIRPIVAHEGHHVTDSAFVRSGFEIRVCQNLRRGPADDRVPRPKARCRVVGGRENSRST